ncbi:hypothetical protein NDU88_007318 [Pleurodeles waltl]|uniref:Uncharacterized protein n=1 Tax=Pleurodeles waltl TaxID=8319 RepID=A0AAV7NWC9_PLEWA|nr:hypothetical protein NDU88_007318 [Pleurodeles waltl]
MFAILQRVLDPPGIHSASCGETVQAYRLTPCLSITAWVYLSSCVCSTSGLRCSYVIFWAPSGLTAPSQTAACAGQASRHRSKEAGEAGRDLEIGNLISELRNESRGFRGRTEDGGRHILRNPAASLERGKEATLTVLAANSPTHLQSAAPETAPVHSKTRKGGGPPEKTGPSRPDHIEVSSAYPRPHTERERAEHR